MPECLPSVLPSPGPAGRRHLDDGAPLRVVALLAGEPGAAELWTLRALAAAPCSLRVVRGAAGTGVSARKRLAGLVRKQGVLRVAGRLVGSRVIGPRYDRREGEHLDRLFDGEDLRRWWRASNIPCMEVPHLNHPEARAAIAGLAPDLLVRVSGGILGRGTFSLARVATLNLHHGMAPDIRGMWSIPWGIVEGRGDWIGATIHEIDDGIDTGRVLWRGSPQLSPGDTGTTLFFRAHLEAVGALARLVREYAEGATPGPWPAGDGESAYRSAPDVWAWARYLRAGRGRRARVILESALR